MQLSSPSQKCSPQNASPMPSRLDAPTIPVLPQGASASPSRIPRAARRCLMPRTGIVFSHLLLAALRPASGFATARTRSLRFLDRGAPSRFVSFSSTTVLPIRRSSSSARRRPSHSVAPVHVHRHGCIVSRATVPLFVGAQCDGTPPLRDGTSHLPCDGALVLCATALFIICATPPLFIGVLCDGTPPLRDGALSLSARRRPSSSEFCATALLLCSTALFSSARGCPSSSELIATALFIVCATACLLSRVARRLRPESLAALLPFFLWPNVELVIHGSSIPPSFSEVPARCELNSARSTSRASVLGLATHDSSVHVLLVHFLPMRWRAPISMLAVHGHDLTPFAAAAFMIRLRVLFSTGTARFRARVREGASMIRSSLMALLTSYASVLCNGALHSL
ncbi:hypothetical protein DFH09DRAFT_1379402 [Mycena vulgaris]|nr:hypothetical protein DFH09DRAFT_1379402 [Mycena vulgaris]